MKIILVIVKYDSRVNAVREDRAGTVHTIEAAEAWINKIDKPAMTYIDGMQNHDAFLRLCIYNREYWAEYKKVID